MKHLKIFTFSLFILSLTSCATYWEYRKAKKEGTITTIPRAYELFISELDSIIADQMSSYRSRSEFVVKNEGFFKVTNISEEQAPYIIGQIVAKKGNTITQEQLPNILKDLKMLDTKIKFDSPEVSMFINKSANVSVDALSKVKAEISAEDKLKIVYEKAFVAVPLPNWVDYKKWEEIITKYGLSSKDSLWVVGNVQVKKFTYAIYKKIQGQFSVTPTPVVAIDGSAFQESGGERNVYEVFIQLNRLRFPVEVNDAIAEIIKDNTKSNTILNMDELKSKIYIDPIAAKEGDVIEWHEK